MYDIWKEDSIDLKNSCDLSQIAYTLTSLDAMYRLTLDLAPIT